MWNRLCSLLHRGFVSNVLSLYGVQFAKYLLPLVTVPYLTRVLGPSGWGLVALTQAYAAYLSLPVDYGFNFSGTRDVSRLRDNRSELSRLFAAVTGAKCLLAFSCILLSWGVEHWVPVFRNRSLLLWSGVFAALAPCLTPIWYFLGLERLKLVASLDITGRAVATVGIFVIVHSRNDAWKVLVVQGVGGSVATVAGMYVAYRELILELPSWPQIWQALRMGRSMFISRSAIGLYTSGNAFILGLFASPLVVGYYAGAEKMIRAALQLSQPPYLALFPKVTNLIHQAPERAFKLVRISAMLFLGSGLLGSFLIFVTAPWTVRIVLGKGFEPAILMLRVLSLLLPLIALSMVQGGLWMIPRGFDRAFEAITLGAGTINVSLAVVLAPRFLGFGVACAVVLAELFVVASMFFYLHFKSQGFWGRRLRDTVENSPEMPADKKG